MNLRRVLLIALAGVVACSSLGDPGAPIAIEIIAGNPAAIEFADPLTLRARVLDQSGDSIGAVIRWHTPDTNVVTLDSVTGIMVAKSAGSARVQAVSGGLASPVVTYTVRNRTDTLIIPVIAESLLVDTADTASAPLHPIAADSLGAPLASRPMTLTIIAPSPAGARLSGNDTVRVVASDGSGFPTGPIRVRRVGVTSGDSVIVRVDVHRPSGALVPGSGQKIRIFFK